MRKILTFVVPDLDITYQELYEELSGHLGIDFEEATRRFAPDEAVPALRYHRRQAEGRAVGTELARRLGVSPEVVFAACTAEGARMLLAALPAAAAIA
jgi:hypothetical protein